MVAPNSETLKLSKPWECGPALESWHLGGRSKIIGCSKPVMTT